MNREKLADPSVALASLATTTSREELLCGVCWFMACTEQEPLFSECFSQRAIELPIMSVSFWEFRKEQEALGKSNGLKPFGTKAFYATVSLGEIAASFFCFCVKQLVSDFPCSFKASVQVLPTVHLTGRTIRINLLLRTRMQSQLDLHVV